MTVMLDGILNEALKRQRRNEPIVPGQLIVHMDRDVSVADGQILPVLLHKSQFLGKQDDSGLSLMGFALNSRTRYSLDNTADMNTWDFNITGELLFTTKHNWQFNSNIGYNFYKGYSKGYGEPELIWNAGIAKDVKAFTFSFKVADILGQQKSLHRTTSAEYVEDVNRIVLGRYFLFGVTFNFGRMNAAQSSKVEQAMWEMAF